MKFTRKWEAAHRLIAGRNANTLCSQPHGHTWSVTVTLKLVKEIPLNHDDNVMVPFDRAKKTWHAWIDSAIDHSFIYNHRDPLLEFMLKENPGGRHVVMPGDPTTEMIAAAFKAKLESFLKYEGGSLECVSLLVQETQTNAIELTESPDVHLPQASHSEGRFWWQRSDVSTHDLKSQV